MKKYYISGIVLPLTIILVIFFIYKNKLCNYLSFEKKVPAGIFIIESWMGESLDSSIITEIKQFNPVLLVTIGDKGSDFYMLCSQHEYLEFKLKKPVIVSQANKPISIKMRGAKADGKQAHMLLFINDSLTTENYVTSWQKNYYFDIPDYMTEINSVKIVFDNDTYTRYRDRNLFVYNLKINDKIYPARSDYTYTGYLYRDSCTKIYHNRNEYIANYIKNLNYTDSMVTITRKKHLLGRTYSDAKTFVEWYNQSSLNGTSVTLITLNKHSRRSCLLYDNLLQKNTRVGCISLYGQSIRSQPCSAKEVFDESISLLYTRMIIIPAIKINHWFHQ